LDDLMTVDKALTSSRTAYDNAMNKLKIGKGNILSRIENIKNMGINATKCLPIESKEEE
jgi:DNA anti-recombination protein RmuC